MKANPGFGRTDCNYGSTSNIPCPKCGRGFLLQIRMDGKTPALMQAVCFDCQEWYNLGTSKATGEIAIRNDAYKRAMLVAYAPRQIQSTLEVFI